MDLGYVQNTSRMEDVDIGLGFAGVGVVVESSCLRRQKQMDNLEG